jgi:hypothetical protein
MHSAWQTCAPLHNCNFSVIHFHPNFTLLLSFLKSLKLSLKYETLTTWLQPIRSICAQLWTHMFMGAFIPAREMLGIQTLVFRIWFQTDVS